MSDNYGIFDKTGKLMEGFGVGDKSMIEKKLADFRKIIPNTSKVWYVDVIGSNDQKVWGIFNRNDEMLMRGLGVYKYQFMAIEKLKKVQKKYPDLYQNHFVGSIKYYEVEGEDFE